MRDCVIRCRVLACVFFFFNDTATTEIYTLSLHDALPICLALMGYMTKPGMGASMVARPSAWGWAQARSEEHTSELQSHSDLVCRLLLEKKKQNTRNCLRWRRLQRDSSSKSLNR